MIALLLLLFSPAMFILAIVFTTMAVKARGRRHLLLFGQPAPGTVQHMTTTTGRVGMMPVMKITLQVTPAQGAPFTATVKQVVSPANAYLFEPGRQVLVRYDPGNHARVALVPAGNA